MKIIEKQWLHYAKSVYGDTGTKTNLFEIKKAFYAGVTRTIIYMRDVIGEMEELEGIDMLEKMLKECDDYYNKGILDDDKKCMQDGTDIIL